IKRAQDISSYYDDLIRDSQLYGLYGEGTYTVDGKECVVTLRSLKKQLYLCLMSVNALEAFVSTFLSLVHLLLQNVV
ncbi:ribonucleotide-diphosphate reductase subunit beta, partial [Haemophilus influenzae PittHH]